MKKRLVNILALLLVLSLTFLAACERPGEPTATDPLTTSSAEVSSSETTAAPETSQPETTTAAATTAAPTSGTTAEASMPTTDPDGVTAATPGGGTLLLFAADARKMVLDRFGSPSIIQKIEYNYDDKDPLYKGEALKEKELVIFELSAKTGEFKKWDVDNDDDTWYDFADQLGSMISLDKAADLVIERSGVDETFVQKIEFDWDEEQPLYKGEAFSQGYKYQFEIEAFGGNFYKWEVDGDDDTWRDQYHNVR